jgi:putative ABC transport system permease protein
MQLQTLALTDIAIALIPVAVVGVITARWLIDKRQVIYATTRMVLQLLLVGYALQALFEQDVTAITLTLIATMIAVSSWIAMRPVRPRTREHFMSVFWAIAVGGSLNLALVVIGVIRPANWHQPALLIPLAGMVYANCMNAVSLAAERYQSDLHALSPIGARDAAFGAAMLPQINSLLAVGLVSLPGMMTGQILSGVSPLIAVRYQIVVMCMVLGSAGLSTALYLHLRGRVRGGTGDGIAMRGS